MILFVNDLTVIDFSYLCEKRGAIGESWIVDLTLHGDLNQESMVLDFGLVKKQIKSIIDEEVDHKLAVPNTAKITKVDAAEQYVVEFEYGQLQDNLFSLALSCPEQAYCFLDEETINMETVANYLQKVISKQLPANVKKVELALRAENISGFYYHYSHGLKKHDGNCQRIVHGHRSTIEILCDGMKSPRLEKQWCDRWTDIYLGSEEDIIEPTELKHISAKEHQVCFAYYANQGYFELAIDKNSCEIIPCDTTVECLSDYIVQQLKIENPDSGYSVKAFEGVGKGSIAYG